MNGSLGRIISAEKSRDKHLLVTLSLLLLEALVLGGLVARLAATAAARAGESGLEESAAKLTLVLGAEDARAHVGDVDGHLRGHVVGDDTHDNCASAVSALVLAEVVATAELLATVGALERLLVGVERAVVALKVLLAAEATRAESADEGLGGILGERLLAATTGGRRRGSVVVLVARSTG